MVLLQSWLTVDCSVTPIQRKSRLFSRSHNCLISYLRRTKKGPDIPDIGKIQPLWILRLYRVDLTLTDSEHLRTAGWTYALSCRLSVLHCYGLSILHFLFSATLHTICFHIHSSSRSFALTLNHLTHPGQAYVQTPPGFKIVYQLALAYVLANEYANECANGFEWKLALFNVRP